MQKRTRPAAVRFHKPNKDNNPHNYFLACFGCHSDQAAHFPRGLADLPGGGRSGPVIHAESKNERINQCRLINGPTPQN